MDGTDVTVTTDSDSKLSKSAKRKLKKQRQKEKKKLLKEKEEQIEKRFKKQRKQKSKSPKKNENTKSPNLSNIDVEWQSQSYDFENNTEASQFEDVFKTFMKAEELTNGNEDKNNNNMKNESSSNSNLNRKEKNELEKQSVLNKLSSAYGHNNNNNNNNDNDNNNNESNKLKKEGSRESYENEDDFEDEFINDELTGLSNRAKKELLRESIAKLKQMVKRPDLVQEHDYNSHDALLLIELKGARNTVPVPPHWSTKRKYLQGKRGFLKPPFKLPDYIQDTGITRMREARLTQLSEKSMKQMQRDRVCPKTGAVVIEYDTLHDAFFKFQTKPEMTEFGDIYYEGKEFKSKYRKFKPGYISDGLKKALGMTARYKVICPNGVKVQTRIENDESGEIEWNDIETLKYGTIITWDKTWGVRMKISAPITGWIFIKNKDKTEDNLKRIDIDEPPPYLISMQRYGPPPSYPDLRIPGLNAPIPPTRQYGFHSGQWGKPPQDEGGRPLYGDPFGVWTESVSRRMARQQRWGLITNYESEESSSDEEDSNEDSERDSDEIALDPTQQTGIQMLDEATLAAKRNAAQALAYEKSMKMGNSNNSNNNNNINNARIQSGIASDMSLTSTATGMMTPSQISLRKHGTGIETPSSIGDLHSELSLRKAPNLTNGNESDDIDMTNGKRLYKVLQEHSAPIVGTFGTNKVYSINGNNDDSNDTNNNNNNGNDEPLHKRRKLNGSQNNSNNNQNDDDNDKEYNVKF